MFFSQNSKVTQSLKMKINTLKALCPGILYVQEVLTHFLCSFYIKWVKPFWTYSNEQSLSNPGETCRYKFAHKFETFCILVLACKKQQ